MMRTLIALLALGSISVAHAGEGFGELTVEQAAARMKEKSVYFFDNNDMDTYRQGHVPGAKWIDYNNYAESALPADKNATLIFYCMNEH
jgi:3-mercaptopyruvate sulfurtransferase SseA